MIALLTLGICLIKRPTIEPTQLLPLCCILAGRLRRQSDIRLLGDLLQFGIRGAVISDHALSKLLDLRRRSALLRKLSGLNLSHATRCRLHCELAVSRTECRGSREAAQADHAGREVGEELMHLDTLPRIASWQRCPFRTVPHRHNEARPDLSRKCSFSASRLGRGACPGQPSAGSRVENAIAQGTDCPPSLTPVAASTSWPKGAAGGHQCMPRHRAELQARAQFR